MTWPKEWAAWQRARARFPGLAEVTKKFDFKKKPQAPIEFVVRNPELVLKLAEKADKKDRAKAVADLFGPLLRMISVEELYELFEEKFAQLGEDSGMSAHDVYTEMIYSPMNEPLRL